MPPEQGMFQVTSHIKSEKGQRVDFTVSEIDIELVWGHFSTRGAPGPISLTQDDFLNGCSPTCSSVGSYPLKVIPLMSAFPSLLL